jgi:hypothetical protein
MIQTLIFLLTFAILASPAYFRFLRSIVGGWAASPEGVAKPAGLLFAGLVFMFVLRLGRRVSGYGILNNRINLKAAMATSNPCDRAKYLQKALDTANENCDIKKEAA